VDHLYDEIQMRIQRNERVLITTLTKRMAEDLTEYYRDLGIRVRYLHSDIETLERIKIIQDLRSGAFDVLIGINLLREGLDLPEVTLVAILDADKEGFLRSGRSLIQTFGRAARNQNGKVILYADKTTDSMQKALFETARRREIQEIHNRENRITPATISKPIYYMEGLELERGQPKLSEVKESLARYRKPEDIEAEIERMKAEMIKAAKNLEFEKAAELRDRIKVYQSLYISVGGKM
jgi:excinuclease ABC subunit B